MKENKRPSLIIEPSFEYSKIRPPFTYRGGLVLEIVQLEDLEDLEDWSTNGVWKLVVNHEI